MLPGLASTRRGGASGAGRPRSAGATQQPHVSIWSFFHRTPLFVADPSTVKQEGEPALLPVETDLGRASNPAPPAAERSDDFEHISYSGACLAVCTTPTAPGSRCRSASCGPPAPRVQCPCLVRGVRRRRRQTCCGERRRTRRRRPPLALATSLPLPSPRLQTPPPARPRQKTGQRCCGRTTATCPSKSPRPCASGRTTGKAW